MSENAPKPAMGSEEVYWIVTLTVQPGQFAKFKELVAALVAATQKEPGALDYRFNIADDQTTVDVFERYRDSAAVVSHVTQTFGPSAEPILAIAKPTRFVVYGTPSDEVKKVLGGFNPVYMTPFDGFTRS